MPDRSSITVSVSTHVIFRFYLPFNTRVLLRIFEEQNLPRFTRDILHVQGDPLPPPPAGREESTVLKLAATTRQDAGTYTCFADNNYGEPANASVCMNIGLGRF